MPISRHPEVKIAVLLALLIGGGVASWHTAAVAAARRAEAQANFRRSLAGWRNIGVRPDADAMRVARLWAIPNRNLTREDVTFLTSLLGAPESHYVTACAMTMLFDVLADGSLTKGQKDRLTDACVPLLKSPYGIMRTKAVVMLGRLGERRVVPSILPLLRDPEMAVSEPARRALERLGYAPQ